MGFANALPVERGYKQKTQSDLRENNPNISSSAAIDRHAVLCEYTRAVQSLGKMIDKIEKSAMVG